MIDLSKEENKKIGIFGLARTGVSLYKALKQSKMLICYDDSEKTRQEFLSSCGEAKLLPIEDENWQDLDYVVLSPSIPTTFPKEHYIVSHCKRHNIEITSDINLLYKARPDANYIAITGTNGKSTTTALIHHILANKNYDIGGNIGIPALSMKNDAAGYILELSSFQLDISKEFHSNIGIILNITPDHIDRHGNLGNYILAKKSILNGLKQGGIGIISVDNKITREIYDDIKNDNKNSIKFIRISTKKIIDHGVCVKGGKIFDSISGIVKEYNYPPNKSLQGQHNAENVAAAYAAAICSGMNPEEVIAAISSFSGLPHRMQFLGVKYGIEFYNDSKATNADAAAQSIGALKNIYWLAGGKSKEGGIESLLGLSSHIQKAYFFGEAKEDFAEQAGSIIHHEVCETLDDAFTKALSDARRDGIMNAAVLLAPACASYDQFRDFEERGCHFIKLYDSI